MTGWVWMTPVVCALIGWLTNFLAIKMLFRPRQPKSIFGFLLQGVIPRRQRDLALKIGEVVEAELLKSEDILNAIDSEELRGHLAVVIETRLDHFVRQKLFRGEFLYEKIFSREAVQRVKRALITELVNLFPLEVEAAIKQLVEKVNIRKIVADRVEQFDFERLENIVYRVARTELFWVEVSGGVLGFVIGVLQVLLLWVVHG
ncbi:MAG TPA: DUF445 family protein [Candidatus Tectomicrobia bacterium]|nr:DUF445 family protein [Candidatus Tectomicrobia bacterium]